MGIYKPPSMSDNDLSTLFIKNIDQCIINYENIIVMGDLNENVYNFIRQKFFDFIELITIAIDVYVGCSEISRM
jgi:hypothetical protein